MKENSINEEEKEEIELDIEAKYVDKTEKEFLSRVTYAECIYILTPENKYCDKIKELSVLKICEIIKNLQKENEELKRLMAYKNGYTKLLEEDLFENCENFVISKDKIKEQIKRYAKLSDGFYGKWEKLSPFDEDYKNIREKGMCCDAIVNALQELLKG